MIAVLVQGHPARSRSRRADRAGIPFVAGYWRNPFMRGNRIHRDDARERRRALDRRSSLGRRRFAAPRLVAHGRRPAGGAFLGVARTPVHSARGLARRAHSACAGNAAPYWCSLPLTSDSSPLHSCRLCRNSRSFHRGSKAYEQMLARSLPPCAQRIQVVRPALHHLVCSARRCARL